MSNRPDDKWLWLPIILICGVLILADNAHKNPARAEAAMAATPAPTAAPAPVPNKQFKIIEGFIIKDRVISIKQGMFSDTWKLACIDGVEYLYKDNDGGLTPHFKPSGELYTCQK